MVVVQHAAVEQYVVDGNHAAGAHQLQAALEIVRGGRFIGINQSQVVVVVAALRQ